MSDGLSLLVSHECEHADLMAFLGSYAVELSNKNPRTGQTKMFFRAPAVFCFQGTPAPTDFTATPSECNCYYWGLKLHQCKARLGQPVEAIVDARLVRQFDTGQAPLGDFSVRWPFYVESPLIACVRLGAEWWQWTFTPGRTYQERNMERCEPLAYPF